MPVRCVNARLPAALYGASPTKALYQLLEEADMRNKVLTLSAGLVLGMLPMAYAAAADAPTTPSEVRQDTKDIRADKRDLAGDIKDRRDDVRDLHADVKAGDAKAAAADKADIKSDTKDIRSDKRDLKADKRDRRHDVRRLPPQQRSHRAH
jgi:hypothetical protein